MSVHLISTAQAVGAKVTAPNGVAPDRYVYYPGTEELGKDEIRLIACGATPPGRELLAGGTRQR